MNMKQSCKALICAIEGELDGRHCTEEQAAAILDHALPSLTEALARVEAELNAKPADDLAQACIAQLIESGAENYAEHHFGFVRHGEDVERPAVVTVQFSDRPSPHDLRVKAEAERDTAQAQLAEAVGLLERLSVYKPQGICAPTAIQGFAIEAAAFLARHAKAEHQEAQYETLEEILNSPMAPCEEEAQGAQAGEFQREDRYIVIKRKDLERLPLDVRMPFILAWSELGPRLPNRDYLVIEGGWPEYEPTWAAIQARVEGRSALATQPAAGEPVAWRFQTCSGGQWHVTTNKMHARMFDGTEDGGQVQELFTAAPPAAAHGDELVAVVGTVPDGSGFKSLDFKVDLQDLPDGTRLYAHGAGGAPT